MSDDHSDEVVLDEEHDAAPKDEHGDPAGITAADGDAAAHLRAAAEYIDDAVTETRRASVEADATEIASLAERHKSLAVELAATLRATAVNAEVPDEAADGGGE